MKIAILEQRCAKLLWWFEQFAEYFSVLAEKSTMFMYIHNHPYQKKRLLKALTFTSTIQKLKWELQDRHL
jgi:dTDP-4-dehydrorhamnose 3,5-epimerase-like enzyme